MQVSGLTLETIGKETSCGIAIDFYQTKVSLHLMFECLPSLKNNMILMKYLELSEQVVE